MEDNAKKERTTEVISGYLGKDAELGESKNEKKMVLSFDIAVNDDKDNVKWTKVQMWDKELAHLKGDLKKGDFVEVKGYHKEYKKTDGSTGLQFVANEVTNHIVKSNEKSEAIVELKGNLGQIPEEKIYKVKGEDKKALIFDLAQKDGENVVWTKCTVWEEKIEKTGIDKLGKNDFVKLEGRFGKEYETKKGEVKRG